MADGMDPGRQAQIDAGARAAQGGDENFFADSVKRGVVAIERVAQAIPLIGWLIPKASGLGENSAMSGLDFDKALNMFKPVAAPLAGLSTQGGPLFRAVAQAAKVNLSAIQGLPIEAASRGDLGTFSPPVFEGMRVASLDMGAGARDMG